MSLGAGPVGRRPSLCRRRSATAMDDWACRYDEPARFTPAGFATSERSTDQVNAKATKPEQSNTRPATVTARKLLEANSSRMVHRLSCAPARTERPFPRTVKRISFRRPVSIRVDVLVQHYAPMLHGVVISATVDCREDKRRGGAPYLGGGRRDTSRCARAGGRRPRRSSLI